MADKIKREIRKLQTQRNIEISRIQELYRLAKECLDDPDDKNKLGSLKLRFKSRDMIYNDFNQVHGNIVRLLSDLDDFDDLVHGEEVVRATFDEVFHSIGVLYINIFPPYHEDSQSFSGLQGAKHVNLRLPKLSLPTFNGNLKEWSSFMDLFKVLVHDNRDLSDIEKFQYLVTSLIGEPLTIVKTIPLNASNYAIAYDTLCQRYQNKRAQSSHYWNEIINAPKINSENPQALRQLLDIFNENLKALENLGFPVPHWDFIIFNLLIKKIDAQSVKRFELQFNPQDPSNDIPSYKELTDFLHKQCLALDSAALIVTHQSPKPFVKASQGNQVTKNSFSPTKFPYKASRSGPSTFLLQGSSPEPKSCLSCNDNHDLEQCSQFLKKTPNQRFTLLKHKNVCVNCFGPHSARQCTDVNCCSICRKKHHSLLHFNDPAPPNTNKLTSSAKPQTTSLQSEPTPDGDIELPQVKTFTSVTSSPSVVFLSTAKVAVLDSRGVLQTVRVLLDSGSQSSFITDTCLMRLGLPRRKSHLPIYGLGEISTSSSGLASCTISPIGDPSSTFNVEVVAVPKICSHLPEQHISLENFSHLANLKLADEKFNQPAAIDMLLGADMFPLLLYEGRIEGGPGKPVALNTIFGWVIMGKTDIYHTGVRTFLTTSESPLDVAIKKFWEIEEIPAGVLPSDEDILCEKIYSETTFIEPNGRYVVSLPFKQNDPQFVDSRDVALRRFRSLEQRLLKNPPLYSAYSEFMQDYLDRGHMSLDLSKIGSSSGQEYFIPHFCIFKPDSATTKLRVVFDASAKDATGFSLNDALLIGPKLQQSIFSLLLNFRFHDVVFTCDIKQMYRQILVTEAHRRYQKILWRFSQNDPIQEFVLNTVTYGVSSSPFLALRTIAQIAEDQKTNYPDASKVLKSDSFVDDLVTGSDSIASALRLQADLIQLLGRNGLEVRKWASNHPAILEAVSPSDCQQQPHSFDNSDCAIKILGLTWLPTLDTFSYTCVPKNNAATKRGILSELARIFDPLGFIAPVSFFAKYLIQYLWVLGIDWDQSVPQEVENRWLQFQDELPTLKNISVPRRAFSSDYHSVELHGFCDGSEKGYAAVVYFRFLSKNRAPTISLVCAKSKISPLKRISVPRLELCGAVLLSNLISEVIDCYSSKIVFEEIYGWCDSKTVIAWIKSSPHRWKTFVSNRVTHIQSKVSQNIWQYISTKENPADCASRGLLPTELINHPLWWAGPPWLHSDILPCKLEVDISDCYDESRPLALVSTRTSSELATLLSKFSNFGKIKRIIAYCLRFVFNWKNSDNKRLHGLVLSELNDALVVLVKQTQAEYFLEDISNIKNKKPVSNQLRRLVPFVDSLGILRVGGRLKHADVAYNYKHPMLLPRQSRLTELIILETHSENFHPGFQTTHSLILQNFWILNPKRAIRSVIGKCLRCFRANPTSNMPLMADLPTFRVNQLKCFSHVCVDMGGPFLITPNRTRGCKTLKAYLCLFVCCSTKALHLEVTSDLSSESFLAALRRFIARRGRVANIYSDCGTNFVASSKYLKDIMQSAFETEKIAWNFNPPAAPHFNGLAEAGIKSVKTHLVRIIGDQILTYEELNTIIVQIEAMLNSRPLSPISSDPNDLNALTPSHFLILEPITALPDFDLTSCKLNTLTRWQLLIRMSQDFWKRWRDEYLHTLSQRYKWNTDSDPPKIDMLVVLKNEQFPPLQWELARVVKLHPGSDGVCRVVTVRTARGLFQRPVVKLCPLPGQ